MTVDVQVESSSIKETDRERVLQRRLRVLGVIGLLFATGLCFLVLTLIPSFEIVFKDIYGTKDKLPHLTRLILDPAWNWSGLPRLALGIFAGLGLCCIVLGRGSLAFWVSIFITFILMMLWIVATIALVLPLLATLQSHSLESNF